jgi:Iap family predicted aminopeptidase
MQVHVDFLAADLLEGRDSGHRGGEIAALYIAAQLEAAGFAPLVESWQQPFELAGASSPGHTALRIGGREVPAVQVATPSFSGSGSVAAPLAEEDEEVGGRIALVRIERDTPGRDGLGRAVELAERGARGVVFVTDADEVHAAGDMRRRYDAPRPPSDDALRPSAAGGMLAESLAIPAALVDSATGEALTAALAAGDEVSLAVEREGTDSSTNVLAVLRGSDPQLARQYVVLGAHYDHVGRDAEGRIWNGADDNASGVAAVLEIAEALGAAAHRPKRSIVLAAWGAEERGLVGSRAFAANPPIPMQDVVAYLNLDMISRNDPGMIEVGQASAGLMVMARATAAGQGLEIEETSPQFLVRSDTKPFVDAKVPTLFFFSGMHEDYHEHTDDPRTIDADKAARVARVTCDMLLALADADEVPAFDAPPRVASRTGRRLGVLLERGSDGGAGGFAARVREVTDDSIAAKAGVRAGDVLVRLDGTTIDDARDLRKALEAVRPGAEFELEVLRDGETVVLRGTVPAEEEKKE